MQLISSFGWFYLTKNRFPFTRFCIILFLPHCFGTFTGDSFTEFFYLPISPLTGTHLKGLCQERDKCWSDCQCSKVLNSADASFIFLAVKSMPSAFESIRILKDFRKYIHFMQCLLWQWSERWTGAFMISFLVCSLNINTFDSNQQE